jgi:hypothetical protein
MWQGQFWYWEIQFSLSLYKPTVLNADRERHGSDGWSPSSHRPGQSKRDLWWTRRSATDLFQVLRFSAVNIISPRLHTHRPISYGAWNGCSLETQCRPISMDNNNMQKSEGLVRFQFLKATAKKMHVFRKVAAWYPDDGDSKHIWNVLQFLPGYTAQNPRRQPTSTDGLMNIYHVQLTLKSTVCKENMLFYETGDCKSDELRQVRWF